jgi:hypothetical protein
MCALAAGAGLQAFGAETEEPLFTLEREFVIPFVVEAPQGTVADSVYTHLYVSHDHGHAWNLYDTSKDLDGSFVFRAPFEGEFWFIVRIGNGSTPATIDQDLEPEMRVVVGPGRAPQQVIADPSAAATSKVAPSRVLNSLTFEIDYTIERSGEQSNEPADKPSHVQLWWTGNGGKSWQHYGDDPDGRSPMRVTVDADGVYGLWLVVDGDDVLPRPGDVPQTCIAIDSTAPDSRLISAEVNPGISGDELTLRWEAGNEPLAEDAISLFYGASAQGPWLAMENVQASRGAYTCRLADLNQAAHQATTYFKLSAHDAAGNVRTCITGEGVKLPRDGEMRSASVGTSTARGIRWFQVLR